MAFQPYEENCLLRQTESPLNVFAHARGVLRRLLDRDPFEDLQTVVLPYTCAGMNGAGTPTNGSGGASNEDGMAATGTGARAENNCSAAGKADGGGSDVSVMELIVVVIMLVTDDHLDVFNEICRLLC